MELKYTRNIFFGSKTLYKCKLLKYLLLLSLYEVESKTVVGKRASELHPISSSL